MRHALTLAALGLPLLACAATVDPSAPETEDKSIAETTLGLCLDDTCWGPEPAILSTEAGLMVPAAELGPDGLGLFDRVGWDAGSVVFEGSDVHFTVPVTDAAKRDVRAAWTARDRRGETPADMVYGRTAPVGCSSGLDAGPRLVGGTTYLPLSWVELLSADYGTPDCLMQTEEHPGLVSFASGRHGRNGHLCVDAMGRVGRTGSIISLPQRDCDYRRAEGGR